MENETVPQMSAEQIKAHCSRMRLGTSDLARRANRAPATAHTLLAGGNVHPHTKAAILAALEAEATDLRDYLLKWFPLEPIQEAAE